MSKRQFDSNGWYEVKNNPISKTGVFQYLGKNISETLEPEEIYNVYRPESSLNNPETINSFKLVPWIPYHEMLGDGFTPAENVGVEGTTGEQVYYKDGTLYGNIKVYGQKLAAMIQDGVKELSLGFRCGWKIESGITPNGEKYDVIQEQILGNHLASVPNGRMGSSVAVMDSSVFALDQNDVVKIEPKPSGENMLTKEDLKIAMDAAIKPIQSALDAAEKKLDFLEKKAEDMDKDEKSAEDMEEEKKKKAEDEEKEKEKSKAMDSAIAQVEILAKEVKTLKSTAMDGNALMKAFAEKQNLAQQVSAVVGAFDHADMDAQGVAKYGLQKMGVACDSGQELAMLKGILHARKTPTFTVDHGNAQDAADNTNSDLLAKAGL